MFKDDNSFILNGTSVFKGCRTKYNNASDFIQLDILQEIDLNSTEIEKVKNYLLQRGLESIIGYHFINTFMRWMLFSFYKYDEDDYWNDAAQLKVYCPEGKVEYGIVVAIAEYKNGRIFIIVQCLSKTNLLVMKDILMTTEIINWKKSLTFEGIQSDLLPLIKDVLNHKNVRIIQLHKKELFVMPQHLAEHVKLTYPGDNIFIERVQLKDSHISLVNRNWDEKGENTEFLVEALIRNNRAMAVYFRRDASLPLAWALRQHYGGIGMVNTSHLQGYENLSDFLPLLIQFMIRYYVIDETQPFTCVSENQYDLIKIFINAGFNKICNLFWITTEGETGYKFIPHLKRVKLGTKSE